MMVVLAVLMFPVLLVVLVLLVFLVLLVLESCRLQQESSVPVLRLKKR